MDERHLFFERDFRYFICTILGPSIFFIHLLRNITIPIGKFYLKSTVTSLSGDTNAFKAAITSANLQKEQLLKPQRFMGML